MDKLIDYFRKLLKENKEPAQPAGKENESTK